MIHRPDAKVTPVLSLLCLISFSLATLGQQTPYTADSLMAAFNSAPQNSPKGAQITFTGVIAEIRPSSVIFKSSGNDRVICELVSSGRNHTEGHAVGSSLTVTGKVRGRGALGNVTLDQCSPVLTDVASRETATIEPPDERREEEEIAPSAVVAITDAIETAPSVIPDAVPSTSPAPPTQATKTPAVSKKPVPPNKPVQSQLIGTSGVFQGQTPNS